jgi:hypothetical protein
VFRSVIVALEHPPVPAVHLDEKDTLSSGIVQVENAARADPPGSVRFEAFI